MTREEVESIYIYLFHTQDVYPASPPLKALHWPGPTGDICPGHLLWFDLSLLLSLSRTSHLSRASWTPALLTQGGLFIPRRFIQNPPVPGTGHALDKTILVLTHTSFSRSTLILGVVALFQPAWSFFLFLHLVQPHTHFLKSPLIFNYVPRHWSTPLSRLDEASESAVG